MDAKSSNRLDIDDVTAHTTTAQEHLFNVKLIYSRAQQLCEHLTLSRNKFKIGKQMSGKTKRFYRIESERGKQKVYAYIDSITGHVFKPKSKGLGRSIRSSYCLLNAKTFFSLEDHCEQNKTLFY